MRLSRTGRWKVVGGSSQLRRGSHQLHGYRRLDSPGVHGVSDHVGVVPGLWRSVDERGLDGAVDMRLDRILECRLAHGESDVRNREWEPGPDWVHGLGEQHGVEPNRYGHVHDGIEQLPGDGNAGAGTARLHGVLDDFDVVPGIWGGVDECRLDGAIDVRLDRIFERSLAHRESDVWNGERESGSDWAHGLREQHRIKPNRHGDVHDGIEQLPGDGDAARRAQPLHK